MSNLVFGLTLLFVGMGGTLITLWALTLIIRGLTAVFPASREDPPKSNP